MSNRDSSGVNENWNRRQKGLRVEKIGGVTRLVPDGSVGLRARKVQTPSNSETAMSGKGHLPPEKKPMKSAQHHDQRKPNQ